MNNRNRADRIRRLTIYGSDRDEPGDEAAVLAIGVHWPGPFGISVKHVGDDDITPAATVTLGDREHLTEYLAMIYPEKETWVEHEDAENRGIENRSAEGTDIETPL